MLFSAGMGSRLFKTFRTRKVKPQPPSPAQVRRAARAILFPEAGDPLPPPGSLLEREAQKFVAFIAKRNGDADTSTRHKLPAAGRPH